jgi:hypothetical protein
MTHRDHEQVDFCNDKSTGLRTIIAVHDTTLGPALGGCRMWPFASEDEALEFNAQPVAPDEIDDTDADVFGPWALRGGGRSPRRAEGARPRWGGPG